MCPESMKEPPDPIPTYQTIKTSLKRVARNDVVIEKLQEATKRANTIMTHGLHLLKLYLLHCYETGLPFPKLDKEFIKEVLKVRVRTPSRVDLRERRLPRPSEYYVISTTDTTSLMSERRCPTRTSTR